MEATFRMAGIVVVAMIAALHLHSIAEDARREQYGWAIASFCIPPVGLGRMIYKLTR
jgi:hypothetical protein